MSPIRIENDLYGCLGLVDINGPVTEGQLDILSHITDLAAAYIKNIKNDDMLARSSESGIYIIKSILKGDFVDERAVSRHLQKLNWKIDDRFYILTFNGLAASDIHVHDFNYIKRIQKCFPKSLITVHEEFIVTIIRRQDYHPKKHPNKKNLTQLLLDSRMKCGVSSEFQGFMKLKCSFVQSRISLDYCHNHSDTALQFYEDCYQDHILSFFRENSDIKSLCHPQILALWESGEESDKAAVRCLRDYIIYGKNIAMMSAVLLTHRNTIIYRINKISQILEMDLKNISANEVFYLLFSCMLVENL
jgi:sugar diacid utilization regulator